jgi:hypothetical protein
MQISSQKSPVKMQNGMGKPIWLVVWNMFSFSIQLGIIIPTGLSYFSEGLKPPTSIYIFIYLFAFTQVCNIVCSTKKVVP